MAADDAEAIDRADASCRILCLTGPESSGKTTLAEALAKRFGARLVPEVARAYLDGGGQYGAEDLLQIARLQVAAESEALADTAGLIVCDTDVLVIRIWWKERFGALPDELSALMAARPQRGYLLAQPDLPWAPDPLRENPQDRNRLFKAYEAVLSEDPMPFRVIWGAGATRLHRAVEAARLLLPGLLASAE